MRRMNVSFQCDLYVRDTTSSLVLEPIRVHYRAQTTEQVEGVYRGPGRPEHGSSRSDLCVNQSTRNTITLPPQKILSRKERPCTGPA